MTTQGWLKLYRELFDKPIWLASTPAQKTILIALLSMANHKERQWEWQGKPYMCKAGQFITSLDSIRKKCGKGVSVRQIRTALLRFEKYGFLTNESTNENRLITICNWEGYQKRDDENDKQIDRQPTSDRQVTDKQLTTNKNGENTNNDNKYPPDSNESRLSQLLLDLILERKPDFKKPNIQRWVVHVDRMIRLDHRTVERVEAVIRWCQSDSFWQNNILSTEKLRKHFDKLELNMQSELETKNGKSEIIKRLPKTEYDGGIKIQV